MGIDGKVAAPGSKVAPGASITVDGKPLPRAEALMFLMLHRARLHDHGTRSATQADRAATGSGRAAAHLCGGPG